VSWPASWASPAAVASGRDDPPTSCSSRAQARQCHANLAASLAHHGGSLRHLLKTITYITHWAYRPLVAAARDELFPSPPYPASTLVVVQGLAEPLSLVEIEGIAVLD
jgi:2-iminobutanoate/2-iminopropanoate deaminase